MSNETMTDAPQNDYQRGYWDGRKDEAARLRGEAAPYFKDADALVAFLAKLTELDGEGGDGFLPWRPAQDAIAGIQSKAAQGEQQAVARIVPAEWIEAAQTISGVADLLSESDEDGLAEKLSDALEVLEAALSAAPAAPESMRDWSLRMAEREAGQNVSAGSHGIADAPASVAGDAVRDALRTLSDAVFGKGLGSEPDVYADYDKLCELQRMTRTALAQDRASQGTAAGAAEGDHEK